MIVNFLHSVVIKILLNLNAFKAFGVEVIGKFCFEKKVKRKLLRME